MLREFIRSMLGAATRCQSVKSQLLHREKARHLSIESLENRKMMAFQVLAPDSAQVLRLVGTAGADAVEIFVDRSSVRVGNQQFSASSVKAIHVGGKGGIDNINVVYANDSYNPNISLWGDSGDDKIEIRNAAGKSITADGGTGWDRIALHGTAFLGAGRQVGFERFWTNAAPENVARAFLNRHVGELKRSTELPMDTSPADNVNCANFVSAVLRSTGYMTASQHENSVARLATRLQSLGWRQVPLSQARPGDVWIDRAGGRSHTELVFSNTNGSVVLIGANNVNADGTQRITFDSRSALNEGSYILSRPW